VRFTGGTLRVFTNEVQAAPGQPKLARKELPARDLRPYGDGLALPATGGTEILDGRVWLDIEFRGGRPVCVGVRVLGDSDHLTTSLLRDIHPDSDIRPWVGRSAYRLIELEDDEIAAEPLMSPAAVFDPRSFEERGKEAAAAHDQVPKGRGRPPLDPDMLRRVAAVAATASPRGITAAIREQIPEAQWQTNSNLRKWRQKAQKLEREESDG
jgi:hypothetical protein